MYLVAFVIGILITLFFKFHLKLLLENKTTIENLEKKKQIYESEFNIGVQANFFQVFGKTKMLWLFPISMNFGKPVGDGIQWPRAEWYKDESEEDDESRSVRGQRQNNDSSVGSLPNR